jgi:hypothetical protein
VQRPSPSANDPKWDGLGLLAAMSEADEFRLAASATVALEEWGAVRVLGSKGYQERLDAS